MRKLGVKMSCGVILIKTELNYLNKTHESICLTINKPYQNKISIKIWSNVSVNFFVVFSKKPSSSLSKNTFSFFHLESGIILPNHTITTTIRFLCLLVFKLSTFLRFNFPTTYYDFSTLGNWHSTIFKVAVLCKSNLFTFFTWLSPSYLSSTITINFLSSAFIYFLYLNFFYTCFCEVFQWTRFLKLLICLILRLLNFHWLGNK